MEELIISTAENKFFFNELVKDGDRVHIHDVDEDVDDVIGPDPDAQVDAEADADTEATSSEQIKLEALRQRYRQIKALYEAAAQDNAKIFADDQCKGKWAKLR